MTQRPNRPLRFPQATAAPTDVRSSGTKVNITLTTLKGPIFWRWYFQQWEALALAELSRREQANGQKRGHHFRAVKAGE